MKARWLLVTFAMPVTLALASVEKTSLPRPDPSLGRAERIREQSKDLERRGYSRERAAQWAVMDQFRSLPPQQMFDGDEFLYRREVQRRSQEKLEADLKKLKK